MAIGVPVKTLKNCFCPLACPTQADFCSWRWAAARSCWSLGGILRPIPVVLREGPRFMTISAFSGLVLHQLFHGQLGQGLWGCFRLLSLCLAWTYCSALGSFHRGVRRGLGAGMDSGHFSVGLDLRQPPNFCTVAGMGGSSLGCFHQEGHLGQGAGPDRVPSCVLHFTERCRIFARVGLWRWIAWQVHNPSCCEGQARSFSSLVQLAACLASYQAATSSQTLCWD